MVTNLMRGDVVMISDYSENLTTVYPVEAQNMHFQNQNQVIILAVAVTVRAPDGSLVDEIHLVLSDHIDKIKMNIQRSLQLILENINEEYGPVNSVFEVPNRCVGQYRS